MHKIQVPVTELNLTDSTELYFDDIRQIPAHCPCSVSEVTSFHTDAAVEAPPGLK